MLRTASVPGFPARFAPLQLFEIVGSYLTTPPRPFMSRRNMPMFAAANYFAKHEQSPISRPSPPPRGRGSKPLLLAKLAEMIDVAPSPGARIETNRR